MENEVRSKSNPSKSAYVLQRGATVWWLHEEDNHELTRYESILDDYVFLDEKQFVDLVVCDCCDNEICLFMSNDPNAGQFSINIRDVEVIDKTKYSFLNNQEVSQ